MSKPREYYIVCDDPKKPIGAYCPPQRPDGVLAHDLFVEKSAYDKAIGALKGFNKYCITPECKCWAGDVLKELGEEI